MPEYPTPPLARINPTTACLVQYPWRSLPTIKLPPSSTATTRGGGYSLFESGAILMYLANKTGRFLPADRDGAAIASKKLWS
jgi:glutathione S-transferase